MPTNITTFPRKEDIAREWFIVDAEGQTLGRLATRVATILMGKHKPTFTPHIDTGDHVVVINAEKVALSGDKEDDKLYRRHSQYPGGLKEATAKEVRAKQPEKMVEKAISRMLPKTKMGRKMYTKLNVYAGSAHPHQAQQPKVLDLSTLR